MLLGWRIMRIGIYQYLIKHTMKQQWDNDIIRRWMPAFVICPVYLSWKTIITLMFRLLTLRVGKHLQIMIYLVNCWKSKELKYRH